VAKSTNRIAAGASGPIRARVLHLAQQRRRHDLGPTGASGLASGLLNMSRGLGKAIRLVVVSSVFSALGGDGGVPDAVRTVFSTTFPVRAGVAVLAGVIGDCRGGGGPPVL